MYYKIYNSYIESFKRSNIKVNYPFSAYEKWYQSSNLYKMNRLDLRK